MAAVGNNSRAWRDKILDRLMRDELCAETAVKVLLYLTSIMKPGDSRNVSLNEIQAVLGDVSVSAISKALKILEDQGYIEKVLAKKDRRERIIKLLEQ